MSIRHSDAPNPLPNGDRCPKHNLLRCALCVPQVTAKPAPLATVTPIPAGLTVRVPPAAVLNINTKPQPAKIADVVVPVVAVTPVPAGLTVKQPPATTVAAAAVAKLKTAEPAVTPTWAGMGFFQSIALPLAARGLRVMPINGKVPFLSSFPSECTTDPKKIKETWAQYAKCNVGVICQQKPGGVLILDDDGKVDLSAEYKKQTGKDAPVTYQVQSTPPKNGEIGRSHKYFWQTVETISLPLNIGEDTTNGEFSLRLDNYQAAGEGSIHPEHGGVYTAICTAPIVPMPSDYLRWLLGRVNRNGVKKSDAAVAKLPDGWMDEPIYEGEIHPRMVKIAAKLRGAGLDADSIFAVLCQKADTQCFYPNSTTPFPVNIEKLRPIADYFEGKLTGDQQRELNKLIIPADAYGKAVATGIAPPLPVGSEMEQRQEEFAKLEAECERTQDEPLSPYPISGWVDTPYLKFAQIGRGEGTDRPNFIPPEYLINGLMTFVGAICGHRITPAFNPTLKARFITILLSEIGGIGKDTIQGWLTLLFNKTDLIRIKGLPKYRIIGCFKGDFASERAMIQAQAANPVTLQVYGEFTTATEKMGIQGSGQSFINLLLHYADSSEPKWSMIKNEEIPAGAPDEVEVSLLGFSTKKRWDNIRLNLETFHSACQCSLLG